MSTTTNAALEFLAQFEFASDDSRWQFECEFFGGEGDPEDEAYASIYAAWAAAHPKPEPAEHPRMAEFRVLQREYARARIRHEALWQGVKAAEKQLQRQGLPNAFGFERRGEWEDFYPAFCGKWAEDLTGPAYQRADELDNRLAELAEEIGISRLHGASLCVESPWESVLPDGEAAEIYAAAAEEAVTFARATARAYCERL